MSDKLALHGGKMAIDRPEELESSARWPVFGDEEKAAVLAVMDAANPYGETDKFQSEFAAYQDANYSLGYCNGTSSIHAAYFAVGVEPGDEVLVSAYTWHLQVGQILALHALPVFCDIDPQSACIDPEDIKRKITPRTKAISVVHPYGALSPMDEILTIAKAHNIPVIEDCSHAHGATYKGRKTGTMGDIGCFSLQYSKLMTGIEGGALVTNNEGYYSRACLLGHYENLPKLSEKYNQYWDPAKEQAPTCLGFKYRMHPLGAAIARVQLSHLDEWNAIMRRNMGYLTKAIGQVGQGIIKPSYERPDTERVWLNYICTYDQERGGVPRQKVIEALCAEGLPATGGRTGYLPVYWNPIYEQRMSLWADGDPFDAPAASRKVSYERGICPVAEEFWQTTIGLPVLHWPVSTELLDEIVSAVDKVVRNLDNLKEDS